MRDLFTCVNGDIVPAANAMLPVADRGLRFGDGVFETLQIHNGVPYQWEAHSERLTAGLAAIRIPPLNVDLQHHVRLLLQRNQAQSGSLRISVTRGVGSHGYLPYPATPSPNWVIEYLPARPLPDAAFTLYVSNHQRIGLVSLPMGMKLAQGLGSTLALMEAADYGCDEALQLSTAGVICAAASANIFWVKGRSVFTPALSTGCLAGTTRARLMTLSPHPVHESLEDLSTLESAEAVFLTNSRLGVWPVSRIEPVGIAYNTAHPITQELSQLIQRDMELYSEYNQLYWNVK